MSDVEIELRHPHSYGVEVVHDLLGGAIVRQVTVPSGVSRYRFMIRVRPDNGTHGLAPSGAVTILHRR